MDYGPTHTLLGQLKRGGGWGESVGVGVGVGDCVLIPVCKGWPGTLTKIQEFGFLPGPFRWPWFTAVTSGGHL